jgi:hypothetical protein
MRREVTGREAHQGAEGTRILVGGEEWRGRRRWGGQRAAAGSTPPKRLHGGGEKEGQAEVGGLGRGLCGGRIGVGGFGAGLFI